MKIRLNIWIHLRHAAGLAGLCFLLALASIIASSSPSRAEILNITAKVNAPLPTNPAIITSPYDQQHFTNRSIIVSGTCGDGAYVVIYRNSTAAGIGGCTDGTFSITIDLSSGANILQAKVYNITDNEGPASPNITVYYDTIPNTPPPPLETAITLHVTSVDGAPFVAGRTYTTSNHPLIRGFAPPLSVVTVNFGNGIECKTTASTNGRWTCALAAQLDIGNYTVRVISISPQGIKSQFPAFSIIVAKNMPPASPAEGLRLMLHFPFTYKIYKVFEPWTGSLVITGGTPPYNLSIDWGDDTTNRLENINIIPVNLTHVFTYAGDFHPKLTATDQAGSQASLQIFAKVAGDAQASSSSPIPLILILVGLAILVIITVELTASKKRAGKRRDS